MEESTVQAGPGALGNRQESLRQEREAAPEPGLSPGGGQGGLGKRRTPPGQGRRPGGGNPRQRASGGFVVTSSRLDFDIDAKPQVGTERQDIGQARNSGPGPGPVEPAPGIEISQFIPIPLGHPPAAVGSTLRVSSWMRIGT